MRTLATIYTGGALDVQVKRKTGLGFYNPGAFDFARLLEGTEGVRANLMDYVSGFSANLDGFERFKFENEFATLDDRNRPHPGPFFVTLQRQVRQNVDAEVCASSQPGEPSGSIRMTCFFAPPSNGNSRLSVSR